MDFEKVVPPFWGFSTKTDLVVHGFTVHGFLFPSKSAKSEDPLYNVSGIADTGTFVRANQSQCGKFIILLLESDPD